MPSESAFDGLLAACAVRHMPSARHTALLDPLQRVLRAGGLLAAVSGCAFVENPDLIPAPEMRWRLVPARYPDCDIRYPIFPASALA